MSTPSQNSAQHSIQYALLLEIGLEEMPSDVIAPTLKQLAERAEKQLSDVHLPASSAQVYGSPRRMTLYFETIESQQLTTTESIIGPPKRAAFDASGNPTRAALGFAKSQGISLEEIQVVDALTLGDAAKGKKGEYLTYKKENVGKAAEILLAEILPDVLSKLTFPRSMRWNKTGVSFVRPIRSIAAIYDGRIIPFSFAGVQSGNRVYGHHMMSPEAFEVSNFDGYCAELSRRKVVVDPDERVRRITTQMQALAKEKEALLDTSNQSLLLDAAYTLEYPKAICGNFDTPFLEIPKEIIITAMAEHQGYFPLYKPEGELLPHFITVTNIETPDMSVIQKGNERVLRARLVDAQFYFDQDRKNTLADFVEALKRVTFQEKLGSVFEKVERIKKLSSYLAREIACSETEIKNTKRAVQLCKADLVSGVVREFTSLQGTMGRIYATLDGEGAAVGEAIEEHYLPKQSGGKLPKSRAGQLVSIGDKLDTIVGCFTVGLIPSGSEDPYALRRAGLGIIQIILSNSDFKGISLEEAIEEAIRQYEVQGIVSGEALLQKISDFLKQRLDAQLQSKNVRYDLRAAVLSRPMAHPWELVECAEALVKFSKQPLFADLIIIFKRVVRILPEQFEGEVDESILGEPAEKGLYRCYQDLQQSLSRLWENREYDKILEKLATLHKPLNQFFEDVLVMDKDEAIRNNRLALLCAVGNLFKDFGDFSKIVEEEAGV